MKISAIFSAQLTYSSEKKEWLFSLHVANFEGDLEAATGAKCGSQNIIRVNPVVYGNTHIIVITLAANEL